MSKKGSLQLSINAIVVLIMAITLLGLGLGFMKTMFAKTTGQFEDINQGLKDTMIQDLKNTGGRIVFDKNDIEIKKGNKKELYFGLRNDLGEDKSFTVNGAGKLYSTPGKVGQWDGLKSVIACFSGVGATDADLANIQFATLDERFLKDGEIAVAKLDIKVLSQAKPGTYQCAMVVKDPSSGNGIEYDRKDFMITVLSG